MLENWVAARSRSRAHVLRRCPRLAKLAAAGTGRSTKVDRSYRVFASERRIKFTEMEYAIPREHAAEAVRRVLEIAGRPSTRSPFRSRSASSRPATPWS